MNENSSWILLVCVTFIFISIKNKEEININFSSVRTQVKSEGWWGGGRSVIFFF